MFKKNKSECPKKVKDGNYKPQPGDLRFNNETRNLKEKIEIIHDNMKKK